MNQPAADRTGLAAPVSDFKIIMGGAGFTSGTLIIGYTGTFITDSCFKHFYNGVIKPLDLLG